MYALLSLLVIRLFIKGLVPDKDFQNLLTVGGLIVLIWLYGRLWRYVSRELFGTTERHSTEKGPDLLS